MALGMGLVFMDMVEQEAANLRMEIEELKNTDPTANLAKTKEHFGEQAWLEALKEIDQRQANAEYVRRLVKEEGSRGSQRGGEQGGSVVLTL